jgi:hypothetical protein
MENRLRDSFNFTNADVQERSWKSLNTGAISVVFINSSLFFLIRDGASGTLITNFLFLVGSIVCRSYFLKINLYRFESSKLKLATQRRKAILLGIAFRENFYFPNARSLLGGSKTLIQLILIACIFALTFSIREYIGLSLLSWSLGLLIIFALSPTWLWIPVLFSMFLLAVGTHQSFGARHAVSFLNLTLIGVQCLLFAWHVSNCLESIKLKINRTPSKQNSAQIALLALAFVGISALVFICIPKQLNVGKFQFSKPANQKMSERNQPNEHTEGTWLGKLKGSEKGTLSTSNTNHRSQKSESKAKTGTNTQVSSGTNAGFNNQDQNSKTYPSNEGKLTDSGSAKSGTPETNSSGIESTDGSENSEVTSQERSTASEVSESKLQEIAGEQSKVSKGSEPENNSNDSSTSAQYKDTKKESASKKTTATGTKSQTSDGTEVVSSDTERSPDRKSNGFKPTDKKPVGKKEGPTATSKIPKDPVSEKKSPNQFENKRLLRSIIIIAITLFISILLLLLARKKKKKTLPESASDKDLPTKSDIAQAMQRFKTEYKALVVGAKTQEDIRALVISLYNLLLNHYEGCGLGKPNHTTPDEFHRNEYIYRNWSKNALAHVTETFNRVFYGNKLPAAKDFKTYCDNIAQLGQMLAKIAPYKTN